MFCGEWFGEVEFVFHFKLKFQSRIATNDKSFSSFEYCQQMWYLPAKFEGVMNQPNECNKQIFVWAKSWEFVLVSCVEIAQARIFVTIKRKFGVRNINCTKLPGSELITSQNLLLSFETARFQHVAVSNLLFFDSLPHCKLIFLMEAHMNIKHETMKRDLQT